MEQQAVYNLIDFNVDYDHPNNLQALNTKLELLLCPPDSNILPQNLGGRNNYYGNSGFNLLLQLGSYA